MRKYDLNNHLFGLNQDITWKEFRQKNIIWWNTVGKQDPKEQPTIKLDNYDFFLKWIEEEYNFSLADYEVAFQPRNLSEPWRLGLRTFS